MSIIPTDLLDISSKIIFFFAGERSEHFWAVFSLSPCIPRNYPYYLPLDFGV